MHLVLSTMHLMATAQSQATSTTDAVQRWLVDGGLIAIATTIFYAGRKLQSIESEAAANRKLGQDNQDDIRDLRAMLYGLPPRPRNRHSRSTDSEYYTDEQESD